MIYDTQYGATFGYSNAGDSVSYHSMRDFGLYPRSKPVIEPPQVKTYTVEIPGADGVLDYTEALTGDVHYYNRTGTFPYKFIGSRAKWDELYHRLLSALHGKQMAVILDEDPGGYYYGRLTVGAPEYNSKRGEARFTITGDFQPYRLDLYSSLQPWIWDTFPFETGIIRDYSEIEVNHTGSDPLTVDIIGSDKPVSPTITVLSGTIRIAYPTDEGEAETVLTVGSHVLPDLIIRNGVTTLTFIGTGTLQIDYRGGVL